MKDAPQIAFARSGFAGLAAEDDLPLIVVWRHVAGVGTIKKLSMQHEHLIYSRQVPPAHYFRQTSQACATSIGYVVHHEVSVALRLFPVFLSLGAACRYSFLIMPRSDLTSVRAFQSGSWIDTAGASPCWPHASRPIAFGATSVWGGCKSPDCLSDSPIT